MAPPKNQPARPSRMLAVLAGLFVLVFLAAYFSGTGSLQNRLKPKLGLDLVGGTTMTLVAKTQDGGPPKGDALEQARQIIEDRVNAKGVAEPEVVTEGNSNIVVSVADSSSSALDNVATTAQLRFRKVLNSVQDQPSALPTPSASAMPSASGSAAPPASASASKSPSATPSASPSASPSSSASPTPSGTASPSGSPTPVAVANAKLLAEVKKKLGATYTAAEQVNDPANAAEDQFAAFRGLSGDEVAVLPLAMQFNIPQITCKQLNKRPPGSIEPVGVQVVSCDEAGAYKYLLDVAKVQGTDLKTAAANLGDTQSGGGWKVDLTFSASGADKWQAATSEAFNKTGCENDPELVAQTIQYCRIAVVLDNTVVSAPQIQAVLRVNSQISGSFTASEAKELANQLKYGALPLTFTQGEKNSISATLGTEQLKAGLLAAGIGMLLVIIYAFFYYRLLGSVIFLSLLLSGLLTYGMLAWLGHTMGVTLTLAAIAGFIVSLGVAADSFVIYFERLKDEIREGRQPRSAVVRAWHRARRTIVTANFVTLLAAATLYFFGVGSVKGFAFALGLATAVDLLVVFLFRYPMMALLASTKAFLSPRVSGLGRVLEHAKEINSSTSPLAKTKEA